MNQWTQGTTADVRLTGPLNHRRRDDAHIRTFFILPSPCVAMTHAPAKRAASDSPIAGHVHLLAAPPPAGGGTVFNGVTLPSSMVLEVSSQLARHALFMVYQ